MRTEQPLAIRLADYQPPAFLIESTELDIALSPNATRVKAKLALRRLGSEPSPCAWTGCD